MRAETVPNSATEASAAAQDTPGAPIETISAQNGGSVAGNMFYFKQWLVVRGPEASSSAIDMAKSDQPIMIGKYAGDRLYDGAAASYVSLDDLAALVEDGQDFMVHDAKTGEDVTRSVLNQIIIERHHHG
jgi:PHB/PHA accumulation regulator DNA-binding domain